METLKTLLIANRGEIAVRIIKTAKVLGLHTVAIYSSLDSASTHVSNADDAVLLEGPDATVYLDATQIISIAKTKNVDAIIPGYGFLSENAEFARKVGKAGLVFVGPSAKCIEHFGIKHTARELAAKANVPIVPGTGLVETEQDAIDQSKALGFPVMLKATAGGGGMGLMTCKDENEVSSAFKTVKSRSEALYNNSGLFIEKFFPSSHHIEVQVFGNGQGKAIHFGERECSIQRRHQKIVEECPSPFVERHPKLRQELGDAAVRLAESINYGSAGTIEYLVDDESGSHFFLEMNTRLQVEHGITELCYGVDLVELMLRQADAELQDDGLEPQYLQSLPSTPVGAAIEARIYAENPAKDYAPSPGTLQQVSWADIPGARIDTWVHRGTKVSASYDPLLAKAMIHRDDRNSALTSMIDLLSNSSILGSPTNIDFLGSILKDPIIQAGHTLTNFLSKFKFEPPAIDVISGGAYTLVEDWPGRPTIGRGFSHSGPMDPLAFRIGNALVGNEPGTEGLEITLSGPDLKFLGAAIIAICGAPMDVKIDHQVVKMWTRHRIEAGQRLTIGRTTGSGCRAYLSIYGGLPTIANWFASKSTAPMTAVGGYQGRSLASGDFLGIVHDVPRADNELAIPEHLIPQYTEDWTLNAMPGPYAEGFLTRESIDVLYSTTWTISHNAARGGIRLVGPRPKWDREDGGEGGSHPSNVIEYGYPVGALNWTGDDPVLFPVDAPDFGGFVSSTTIVKADFWKLGQMKAGNKLKLKPVSYDRAISKRQEIEDFVEQVTKYCNGEASFEDVEALQLEGQSSDNAAKAIIHHIEESGNQPLVSYRQGGDDFILIDYGHGSFDLNYRCRAVALYRKMKELKGPVSFAAGTLHSGMACGNSLMIHYDALTVGRAKMMELLLKLENELGDLSESKFASRKYRLPITFESRKQKESLRRYSETQRPYASYLPDPAEFVAKNNAFTNSQLRDIFTKSTLMVVAVGFFVALPIALPIDPRQRIQCPKMNPSRVHTPEGQVGWGGSCMALYNVESPGGYMNIGLSIPGADILGYKNSYNEEKPWLFEDFDQITFYEVSEGEYNRQLAVFHSSRYEYDYEETTFDLKEHNVLLKETAEEVKTMRNEQRRAQREMDSLENELLARWTKEKESIKPSVDTIQQSLQDPAIVSIEAPLNANVWKIEVEEGDSIKGSQILAILEAMKLEVPVKADNANENFIVEKLIAKPGEIVEAGKPLILLRKT